MSLRRAQSTPWWAGGSPEVCSFCLGLYAYELEVRCTGCDRAVCPLCTVAVHSSRAVLCPECPGAGGEA